jgi:WD40 repeat protein
MDIDTGKIIFSHQEHTAAILHVAFNEKHDEVIFVSKDSTVRVTTINGDNTRLVHLVDDICYAACTTKQKSHLLIATDHSTVFVLRIAEEGNYVLENTIHLEKSVNCIACPTRLHQHNIGHDKGERSAVSLSSDMDHAAFGFADGSVMLYDLVCDCPLWHVTPHTKEVFGLHFSHDGMFIATGSRDKSTCILLADKGVNGGTEAHRCEGHNEHVRAVAFGDQGQLLTGAFECLRSARV